MDFSRIVHPTFENEMKLFNQVYNQYKQAETGRDKNKSVMKRNLEKEKGREQEMKGSQESKINPERQN